MKILDRVPFADWPQLVSLRSEAAAQYHIEIIVVWKTG